jgi:hypothetical protein
VAREASLSDQFDAPWKVAVERFLQPLLQLCFRAVHDAIDWRHRPEFLDTELQALGPDHQQGARTVDKLVKVRRLDGADQWLFLHIEIQSQPTAQFPWRMWVYYYRLCDKYGPAVVSLAILADADAHWRPHTYETEIAGCGLRFEFPVFKVLDFEDAETRLNRQATRLRWCWPRSNWPWRPSEIPGPATKYASALRGTCADGVWTWIPCATCGG